MIKPSFCLILIFLHLIKVANIESFYFFSINTLSISTSNFTQFFKNNLNIFLKYFIIYSLSIFKKNLSVMQSVSSVVLIFFFCTYTIFKSFILGRIHRIQSIFPIFIMFTRNVNYILASLFSGCFQQVMFEKTLIQ